VGWGVKTETKKTYTTIGNGKTKNVDERRARLEHLRNM